MQPSCACFEFCFEISFDAVFKTLLPGNLQMGSIVDELGPFEDAEALRQGRHPQNWVLGVLQRWTHVLEFDLFHKDIQADGDGRKSVAFPPCPLSSRVSPFVKSAVVPRTGTTTRRNCVRCQFLSKGKSLVPSSSARRAVFNNHRCRPARAFLSLKSRQLLLVKGSNVVPDAASCDTRWGRSSTASSCRPQVSYRILLRPGHVAQYQLRNRLLLTRRRNALIA